MEKITLEKIERMYKNNGQHKEQIFRYTLTGKIYKADNLQGADLWDIQVKSSKASICKGTDYVTFIQNDVANRYAYVIDTCDIAYIMNKQEYTEFVRMFSYVTVDSGKNNGHEKIRLKQENKAMIQWLESNTL